MFNRNFFSPIETGGNTSIFAYKTDDVSLEVLTTGYFNDAADVVEKGSGIIVISLHGTFTTYVSSIEDGVVETQVGTNPVLEGDIVSQNEISVPEIEAILDSYGIAHPLNQDISMTFRDPTDHPNKAFYCTYDVDGDQWFFEKLDPCPEV